MGGGSGKKWCLANCPGLAGVLCGSPSPVLRDEEGPGLGDHSGGGREERA